MKTGFTGTATLTLAFAFLLLAPSLARADWSAATTVSGAGSSTSQTRIAGGSDGDSWVVWKRNVGGFDVIQGTPVAVDGTQGPIHTISTPGQNATDPVIEARADGSAMVAWLNLSAADATVYSRSIAADGALGPVEARSAPGPAGRPAKDIAIAVGDDGSAGLAWLKFNGLTWTAQAVRVAPDGSSGEIHTLTEGFTNAGPPDIAAVPPIVAGSPSAYRIFWPQGSGDDSNVGSREISAEDALSDLYLALVPPPDEPPLGGDPFDVQVGFDADGGLNAMWIRHREDIDPQTGNPFHNWAVEWIQTAPGTPLNPLAPVLVTAVSPVVPGQPYNISSLTMSETFGGAPVVAWVHDLNGGGQRLETGRLFPAPPLGSTFQAWANPSGALPVIESPVIEANPSGAAVSGWVEPGPLPGQDEVSWTRFSNSSFEPFSPTGSFVFSRDIGFSIAGSGLTLAAFTAIDGAAIGTSRVMAYRQPGVRVDPPRVNFGRVDIGQPSIRTIVIDSTGQTPVTVTRITLSGAGADRYELVGADSCVRQVDTNAKCSFNIRFTPGSTAVQNAQVTVNTEVGSRQTDVVGSGVNRTRNRVTATPRSPSVRRGRVVRVRVRVANVGGVATNRTRICANYNRRAFRVGGSRCRTIGAVPPGATRTFTYRVRVTWRLRRGTRRPVIFRVWSNNALVRQAVVRIRRVGR